MKDKYNFFTPFRIKDAQYATPSPLITPHKVGVYPKGEKRCKNKREGVWGNRRFSQN